VKTSSDFIVPPRSWDSIGRIADQVRDQLGLTSQPYAPVLNVLERVLDQKLEVLSFQVGDRDSMGNAEGLTAPDGSSVVLREDVYVKALRGDGRARFTVAHELGHWFLHTGVAL